MKKRVFFLFLCFLCFHGNAQKIELNGIYQGKNLYVQNPWSDSAKAYCTEKIVLNGKEIPFDNISAYEIKLDSLGFKLGDAIKVEIFHKADCKPKVLSDHSARRSDCEFTSVFIDSVAVLHWKTKKESGKLPFVIEQFRWNKWVKVGDVDGKGHSEENEYTFQTIPHSDKNQFRVKQIDYIGTPSLSTSVYFTGPKLKIKISKPYQLADVLEFSAETMYELYDSKGDIVKKGTGKKIDLKGLKKGSYYLNYDNKMEEVVKLY